MKASRIPKCDWVRQQTQQAAKGSVTLRDGLMIPIWIAYRCLYCGEYFNQVGAETHFGKKRKDHEHEVKGKEVITILVEEKP